MMYVYSIYKIKKNEKSWELWYLHPKQLEARPPSVESAVRVSDRWWTFALLLFEVKIMRCETVRSRQFSHVLVLQWVMFGWLKFEAPADSRRGFVSMHATQKCLADLTSAVSSSCEVVKSFDSVLALPQHALAMHGRSIEIIHMWCTCSKLWIDAETEEAWNISKSSDSANSLGNLEPQVTYHEHSDQYQGWAGWHPMKRNGS